MFVSPCSALHLQGGVSFTGGTLVWAGASRHLTNFVGRAGPRARVGPACSCLSVEAHRDGLGGWWFKTNGLAS